MTVVRQFVLLLALIVSMTYGSVINKEVTRIIDASNSVIRITTDIKAANVNGEYQIVLSDEFVRKLAFLSVSSKGKTIHVPAPVS